MHIHNWIRFVPGAETTQKFLTHHGLNVWPQLDYHWAIASSLMEHFIIILCLFPLLHHIGHIRMYYLSILSRHFAVLFFCGSQGISSAAFQGINLSYLQSYRFSDAQPLMGSRRLSFGLCNWIVETLYWIKLSQCLILSTINQFWLSLNRNFNWIVILFVLRCMHARLEDRGIHKLL